MLARMQKSLKEKDQGFTLIELLVVIVIIGILAAIAIPVFLSQREKGVQAGIKSDLKALATAQETYYVDNASYASAVTEADLNFKKTEGNVITLAVNSATKPTATASRAPTPEPARRTGTTARPGRPSSPRRLVSAPRARSTDPLTGSAPGGSSPQAARAGLSTDA